MNIKSTWLAFGLWLGVFAAVQAQEIGFVEDFVLAADRQTALAKLVPGTDEYYYFHALHAQHQMRLDDVDQLHREWVNRLGNTARAQQIEHRQALLRYDQDPQATLTYLTHKLGLRFDHQREIPDTERDLPSQLDQQLISFEAFARRALAQSRHTDGFHDSALFELAQMELDVTRARHLLQRVKYPDLPNLTALIARDLRADDRPAFGYLEIHKSLTIEQLDALAEQMPELKQQASFVHTYLSKLRPSDDIVSFRDHSSHRDYLERLWAFAQNLDPVFNSLKANILLQRLQLDRQTGEFEKGRLLEYLKLPKYVPYARADWLSQFQNAGHYAQLGADYREFTRLIPVPNDEHLVRYFLMHYLRTAANPDEFAPYVADEYLRPLFAEVKLTSGQGDPQQWASWIPPDAFSQLMQRVDLEFDATLPRLHGMDDPVHIRLTTKNVNQLIVKVFEINTEAYYRLSQREIDTDINIDGLVPHWEQTYQYDDPSMRRVEREFAFDQLKGPGVWVIDFIGNGKSSRALIRKGELYAVVETTVAGQMFTVHDGQGQRVTDATLWIAGREYQPLPSGEIVVPFTTQPRRQAAILSRGSFSTLTWFDHEAETYTLEAGIHIDRESLVRNRRAHVLLRPQLYLNGLPVTNQLLKDWRLQIVAVDGDGVPISIDLPKLEWQDQAELQQEFQVPADLRTLRVSLAVNVASISEAKDLPLTASEEVRVNQIHDTASVRDLHLLPTPAGFVLEVRGKTGEPLSRQVVQLSLTHRQFRDPFAIALQADANGLIHLGRLSDVRSIQAQLAGTDPRDWVLDRPQSSLAGSYHLAVDERLTIPYPVVGDTPHRNQFALFALRLNIPIADHFEALAHQPGRLVVNGLAAGDYLLVDKSNEATARIRVADGAIAGRWVTGSQRVLERRHQHPLFVASVGERGDEVVVQLAGNLAGARVHVIANRYWPRFDVFTALNQVRDAEPLHVTLGWQSSAYIAGRDIGDEYRYILDRKYSQKFPGNLLDRPSLILQPWSRQETVSEVQSLKDQESFGQSGEGVMGGGRRGRAGGASATGRVDPSSLDFLADGSVVLWNLVPDEQGRVVINKEHFDDRHQITIVAVNDLATQRRTLTLAPQPLEPRDLRLAHGLDPSQHAALLKNFRTLGQGDSLTIDDLRSAKFQSFSSVGDIYRFYQTLSNDPTLNEFRFVADWGTKTDEEKLTLYSRYACHELNVFLSHKDPEFFSRVVQPWLNNKRAPAVVDRWLLDARVDEFLDPWQFQRLNVAEKLLLARRLEDYRMALTRHIQELYQLRPTPRAAFDRLFDVAVNTRTMDAGRFDLATALLDGDSYNMAHGIIEQSRGYFGGGGAGGLGLAPPQTAAPAAPPADALSARRVQANMESDERGKSNESRDRAGADKDMREDAGEWSEALAVELEPLIFNTIGREISSGLLDLRETQGQLYRRLPPIEEWVETYYYKTPFEQVRVVRSPANRFWRDYATHLAGDPDRKFLSAFFPEAASSFTEMMFALAVLDVPFEAPPHVLRIEDEQLQFAAGGDAIVFYQQVLPAEMDPQGAVVLVAENFFRSDDRYRMEGNQQYDKFVTDEFLIHVTYGAQVVLTNPTSTPQLVDLLVQIPVGALPVAKSQMTRSRQLELAPFSTQAFEYHFYFPHAGEFGHFPAHVSIEQRVVAAAAGQTFRVVDRPSQIDRRSWAYLSQHGSDSEVLGYFETENILAIDLGKIAFRMNNRDLFNQVLATLRERRAFDTTLWSYGVKHNDSLAIGEYLRHATDFLRQLGPALESPLVTVDPVDQRWYEHREYWPLVNARAHTLGIRRQITNARIYQQYHQLLDALACRPALSNEDRLALVYYLLLQDRIEEALDHFGRLDRSQLVEQMPNDYLSAYLAFYREAIDEAEAIARPYADYPHERWRNLFGNVLSQVAEIRGGATVAQDARDRQQRQDELAAQAPALEFTIEARKILIDHRNLNEVEIRYYQMDIELLFSRNPFIQQTSQGFALIRPNHREMVALAADQHRTEIDLPATLHNANLMIEVRGGGQIKSRAYYAHSLIVELQENYGQLRVLSESSGQPLAKVYVKVFARKQTGRVEFYKDGYTDLRGRFDYVSLSNQSLDQIDRFAILILSDDQGAVIREAAVPKE